MVNGKKVHNMKKQKKICLEKTAGIFNDSVLSSADMFMHCSRIPDVMIRVIRAREVLKRYGMQVPEWMFGLVNKGEVFDSPVPLRVMSFLVSLGLYDRLVRFEGIPDFLVGHSQALLVSAKIKAFDRSFIKVFRGMESQQESFIVYKKRKDNISRFSLLHFSQAGRFKLLKDIIKEYGIDRCILICTSPTSIVKLKEVLPSCTFESLVERDPQLYWFWPILNRSYLKKKMTKAVSGPLKSYRSMDLIFTK